jgi:hypothetical protein
MKQYATRDGFVRAATTVYTTRVDRAITSTVFVTAAAPPASTGVSSIASSPVPEVSATVGSSEEGSMVVQTTGVSQGTPSFPDPSATEDTPPAQPNPTAPPFTCPDDNGMTISQMLGSERFDYDVFCDTTIESESVPIDLSFDTFQECVAACSSANAQFGQPVCQGAVFFETTGTNCFFKSAANATDAVAAMGVDLAILRRVAVGVSAENNDGTSTVPVAFSGETPTQGSIEVGSMIGGMLGNGTSTIAIIIPNVTPPPAMIISGRPAMDGVTAYSTFVSNGVTVSTGTGFSSYTSNSLDGSWFSTFYSEWSVAWSDAQTIYSAGETAVPIVSNNTGTSVEHTNGDGGYTQTTTTTITQWTYESDQTIQNVTELTGTNEYDASGVLTYSTTVTNFYTYTQAAGSGSSGGSGGGIAGSGAGVVTSTTVSSFSTQTIIYNSGSTGGSFGGQASGGQVIQTPGPVIPSGSVFSTQSVNIISGGAAGSQGGQGGGGGGGASGNAPVTSTFTSAFSTQTVVVSSSNVAGSAGGGGGGQGGGPLGSTVPIAGGSSVIFISGGTAYSTGGVISGVVSMNGTSGATSAVGSGAMVTETPTTSTFTELSVISISGGTGGAFSTGGSGQGVGTGSPSVITSVGSSGGALSFSNTNRPRSGTFSTGSSFSTGGSFGTGDSGFVTPTESPTGPAPYLPASATPSGSIPALNGSIPVSTGAFFTNSQTLRTGGFSTSSGPALSSGPSGSIPTVNVSLPVPTGTFPGSFTNSQTLRTGLQTSSHSGPVPYPPFPTVPAPSSEIPSLNVSLPTPTGTAPGTAPFPPLTTGPSSVIPPVNASIPVGTGAAPPVISLPSGTGSIPGTFSNTNRPRSGTLSTGASSATSRPMVIQTLSTPTQRFSFRPSTSTGGASMALSTGASSFNGTILPFPTGTAPPATSCPPMAVSTNTFWATTTEFGCYDFCPPRGGGGGSYGPGGGGGGFYGPGSGNPNAGGDAEYRGPQSFGPPVAIFAPTLAGNPIPEPTEPTSSA